MALDHPRTRPALLIRALVLTTLAALALPCAQAASDYWGNSSGGSWTNAANWNALPGAADSSFFTNSAAYTVTAETGVTNTSMTLDAVNGAVTLNASGNTLIFTNQVVAGQTANRSNTLIVAGGTLVVSNSMVVGNAAGTYGTLVISNGATVFSGTGKIGSYTDYSNNTVIVTGSGSMWTNTSTLWVGSDGPGTRSSRNNSLLILAGGAVYDTIATVDGSGTKVVVAGSGSKWVNAGKIDLGPFAAGASLLITNGGQVVNAAGAAGSRLMKGASVFIAGSGSVWSNTAGVSLGVSDVSNRMVVTDGGTYRGADSIWVGNTYNWNFLVISNGGQVVNSLNGMTIGTSSNSVIVTGSNSLLSLVGQTLLVGSSGSDNQFLVLDGATVTNSSATVRVGGGAGGNNLAVVAGSNSLWFAGPASGNDFHVGFSSGGGNRLVVSNGGTLLTKNVFVASGTGGSNSVLVSGAGSFLGLTNLNLGVSGAGNQLVVSNGGVVAVTQNMGLGSAPSSSNNTVLVTGGGSLLRMNTSGSYLSVGTNSLSVSRAYGGQVLVTAGGTLEANEMYAGLNGSGIISNNGGVYQFSLASGNYIITPNTVGAISLVDGTIAFRSVQTVVDTRAAFLTNITFSGNNSFMLNSATSSASQASYTFNTGLGATNFYRLVLAGTNALWNSPSLTLGSGGELYTSNSVGARVVGVVTNAGSVKVYDSILTFSNNVVLNGGTFLTQRGTNVFNQGLSLAAASTVSVTNGSSTFSGTITNAGKVNVANATVVFNGNVVNLGAYVSDPSTNSFNGDFTVGPTGYVSAAAGDIYAFGGNFLMQSTNTAFNLASAHVVFATNGYSLATTTRQHLLSISNSGALNIGAGYTNFSQVASNFAIGALSVESGDRLTLAGNKTGSQTNALYVGWLDIQGSFDTNNYTQVTNALALALNLPNVNLYYDKYDLRNGWLNANLINDSASGYNLWGGGLLLPIPEPSAGMALGAGVFVLALLRLRRKA